MTPAQDKNEALFRKYIDPKKIMITDPCMGMRAGLAKTLTDMGARPGNIKLCRDYDTADQLMPAFKPEIVLCEYDLGPRCGLDLLQAHRAANPESKKSLFILITSNSSQSAVAQAEPDELVTLVRVQMVAAARARAVRHGQRAALGKRVGRGAGRCAHHAGWPPAERRFQTPLPTISEPWDKERWLRFLSIDSVPLSGP